MSKDLIKNILLESESYSNFDDIEKLIDSKVSFSALPIQPLYIMIKNLAPTVASGYLHLFTKEQRSLFLDLDMWKRIVLILMIINIG